VATAILALGDFVTRWVGPRTGRTLALVVTVAVAVRFAAFATKAAEFHNWTQPYERYAAAVRRANPAPSEGSVVSLDPLDVEGIPALYLDPAAEVASCGPDVHVVIR
jgi:hypothetical protein